MNMYLSIHNTRFVMYKFNLQGKGKPCTNKSKSAKRCASRVCSVLLERNSIA